MKTTSRFIPPSPAIPAPGSLPANAAEATRSGKSALPLHPVAFAVFPLLSLYAANIGQVPWTDIVRPFGLSLAAMAVLYLLLALLLRSVRRAAVMVSAALFCFFTYGHFLTLKPAILEVLVLLTPNAFDIDPDTYLLPIWGVALIGILAILWKSRRDFGPVTAILNVVGSVLVAIPMAGILTSGSRYPGFAPVSQISEVPGNPRKGDIEAATALSAADAPQPTAEAPDIYYIILDAYGREDVLKRFYGYDNRPFLDALRQRGFFIADQARPNYCQTIASVASSLNMSYLDTLVNRLGKEATDLSPLHDRVDHNAVAAFLRERGYRFVSISTGFGLTATPDADLILGGVGKQAGSNLNPYEGLLLDLTPLSLFPRTNATLHDQHRDTLMAGFQYLGTAPDLKYRKFVFAHILAPHPPFVFGPNGEKIDQKGRPYSLADGSDWMHRGDRAEYRERYIGQLRFVNGQVLEAIDTILATSGVRPIILLQGDHGPRQFLDWKSLKGTNVQETYGNLSAYELPGGDADKVFYSGISPVNSFRLLFDHVFGAHFERLPDRSFYSTLDFPYEYTDVTNASAFSGRTQP